MRLYTISLQVFTIASAIHALQYDPTMVQWNLNQAQHADDPMDYWGEWHNHTYNPSPENWRFPFYTLMLDKWVNGDPKNDDANGTIFEHDLFETQLRHGGDIRGLMNSLDYLQGMGIKGIYCSGTILLNQPWGSDGYSPLDLTLIDPHLGTIDDFREAITEIHRRGMYIILDNTISTMGDLVAFEGYLNASTPFSLNEHRALWRGERQYHDFKWNNEYNDSCEYPRFWGEDGYTLTLPTSGCYNSEFDQYGDTEAFGVFPDWQRQLSKFASLQDRLREWRPTVGDKIKHFSCIIIAMLDIDGFRIDKTAQITVDFLADWGQATHDCARRFGKNNFFIPGEVTGGDRFGAIYMGRGRQPNNVPPDMVTALTLNNMSNETYFLRPPGKVAIDGIAFHYSMYRALTRFLWMDGNLEVAYDTPVDFTEMWNLMSTTNDFVNSQTNKVDPRHLWGVTNQDVFRWPAIVNGTQRQNLGAFACALVMPGLHTILWGEEQEFHLFDSTAANYLYGRQAMSSSQAWQDHGCYKLNSSQYFNFGEILDRGRDGCKDARNSLDHRDPTAGVRRYFQSMYYMRENFPSLKDGFILEKLSTHTTDVYLPGSNHAPTRIGLWSVARSPMNEAQDFSSLSKAGNLTVWLLYTNMNDTVAYSFNCSDSNNALMSPYIGGQTVKNLFWPYEEYTLGSSRKEFYANGSAPFFGCLDSVEMNQYSFKALVPKTNWIEMYPVITSFSPGHDARIISNGSSTILLEFKFSQHMSCESVTSGLTIKSTTQTSDVPQIRAGSVTCSTISPPEAPTYIGALGSSWVWKATLEQVNDGIHQLTLTNISNSENSDSTRATDTFLLRVGKENNPMVFPRTANVSTTLLHRNNDGKLYITHQAAGAEQFRYSTNFGSSYSEWLDYGSGEDLTLNATEWTGTEKQRWVGEHVTVQYWSSFSGSSSHIQEGDLELPDNYPALRRWPHVFMMGPFNLYGYDAGIDNGMKINQNGEWTYDFLADWPANVQANLWGVNPDGKPDQSYVYGDVDGDSILDRLPPSSLAMNSVNITVGPTTPYLSWQIVINDGSRRFILRPRGSRQLQIIMFVLLWVIPPLTAIFAVLVFKRSFYQVKFNSEGTKSTTSLISLFPLKTLFSKNRDDGGGNGTHSAVNALTAPGTFTFALPGSFGRNERRRTILIATLEYDIADWDIKIKIGGLGVMAQLMAKNLGHQDLVWVVPCVGDVEYPKDIKADPIQITILKKTYNVSVMYHQYNNIKYILLDAPVFRRQSSKEPYPSRMDDLESAVFYSAWNQCIAHIITRFDIDLYHINDYHGALAPIYLLPDVIPCVLSLHNAEFQGLWPLRTPEEKEEVCSIYNIDEATCSQYVQFGNVFNLLHSGVSYLRIHQKGFGVVGVSKKYGKRSWARYPIFWGLTSIGKLPNPDPSDTGAFEGKKQKEENVVVDRDFEEKRAEFKRLTQEWAGLTIDPAADLIVFVGRWSMQKGIDLIADIAPTLLEKYNVQLLCVGPVIDMYGRFAAEKLSYLMTMYPGRVFSRPEFTALPHFIFSGAEFALIPSRDEPFGLVAVEFGRKGALGIGARVGGLGSMPGWWYSIESTTTKHLITQFEAACHEALLSDRATRELMRAKSAMQRFPVIEWIKQLDKLQVSAIRISKRSKKQSGIPTRQSAAGNEFRTSSKNPDAPQKSPQGIIDEPKATSTPNMSSLSVVSRRNSHQSLGDSQRESYPDSIASDTERDTEDELTNEGVQTPTNTHVRNISDLSLKDKDEDACHVQQGAGSSPNEPGSKKSNITRRVSLGRRLGPGHTPIASDSLGALGEEQLYTIPVADDEHNEHILSAPVIGQEMTKNANNARRGGNLPQRNDADQDSDSENLPDSQDFDEPQSSVLNRQHRERESKDIEGSNLSLASVLGGRDDFALCKVEALFNDADGKYFKEYSSELQKSHPRTSKYALCIEEFITRSEKQWSSVVRNNKLGIDAHLGSDILSHFTKKVPTSPSSHASDELPTHSDELPFLGYRPPQGMKLFLQRRFGDWPLYTFFLALGQVIAASSFQLTLLTDQTTQSATHLYALASIYLVASVIWWFVYCRLKAVYCLSIPFYIYALAFFLIGLPSFSPFSNGRKWINNTGTGFYAVASASGSLFFSLNFADEGGAPVTSWVYRACIIQGTQQLFAAGLWYWGHSLSALSAAGMLIPEDLTTSTTVTAVTWTLAAVLVYVGVSLFIGLPDYYRQLPSRIPAFYKSLTRRKLVLWFFVTVIVQNFWLSAPYGRNWAYLWSGRVPSWQIVVLIAIFFLGVWSLVLLIIGILSRKHSWLLPVFAIGLGSPRWCQMLWGTTTIGMSLPWADIGEGVGRVRTGLLLGKSLWLWLGVLDAIQGVGFGMMLLQTLTRMHIAFTLVTAQVLGSIATIVARAIAPNNLGPGDVFPDFSYYRPGDSLEVFQKAWFYIGLLSQIAVCFGYFLFFRKEQLAKP